MPHSDKPTNGSQDGFREAIARWRLDLRTEVKKSSSLPTAMFDACDPMLETRLAETARSMLERLQAQEAAAAGASQGAEKRLERVTPADLKKLPAQIAAMQPAPLDLEAGLLPEYLGILADTCSHATGAPLEGAARLLARDFGLSTTNDLQALTELLGRELREAPEMFVKAASYTDDQLALACQRVAAALAIHVTNLPAPEATP